MLNDKQSREKWSQVGPHGPVTIHVIQHLRNVRDLRSLMLEAAFALQDEGLRHYVCLLHDCALKKKRLKLEFDSFQGVIRDDIKNRISFVTVNTDDDLRQADRVVLDITELHDRYRDALLVKPKASSREDVIGGLIQRRLMKMPPINPRDLAAQTGASLTTVYSAVNDYKQCIERDQEGALYLARFGTRDWERWLSAVADWPKVKFVDRSGAPRSPDKLSNLITKMGRSDVAIGGVLGAMKHYPELDITAAPHLDLVVHGSPNSDLSFIKELDPGLELADPREKFPLVIVHFVNQPANEFETSNNGKVYASLPQCLADMWGAGLTHQVEDVLENLRLK